MKKLVTTIVALATVLCLAITVCASPMTRASDSPTYGSHTYNCSIYHYNSSGSYTVNVGITEDNGSANSYSTRVYVTVLVSPNDLGTYTVRASAGSTLENVHECTNIVVASSGEFYVNEVRVAALYGR